MTTPYRMRKFVVEMLAMVVLAAWYAGLALFWPGVRDREDEDYGHGLPRVNVWQPRRWSARA